MIDKISFQIRPCDFFEFFEQTLIDNWCRISKKGNTSPIMVRNVFCDPWSQLISQNVLRLSASPLCWTFALELSRAWNREIEFFFVNDPHVLSFFIMQLCCFADKRHLFWAAAFLIRIDMRSTESGDIFVTFLISVAPWYELSPPHFDVSFHLIGLSGWNQFSLLWLT